MGLNTNESETGGRPTAFATTHWSVVLKAGDGQSSDSAKALESLCRDYWYPLYAYIRRLGRSPHDAQDLTQSFFGYLLEKGLLSKAVPQGGHFRSFLLGCLNNFMANEWRRQHSAKRGGGQPLIPLDAQTAEGRYAREPVDAADPQALYEQAWAVAVIDQSIARLEAEYATAGKAAIFDNLCVFLQGERGARTYVEIGAGLRMSEGAVKVAVYRLRQRYRELLRAAVANTVAEPMEVDAELRHLLRVLGR